MTIGRMVLRKTAHHKEVYGVHAKRRLDRFSP